MQKNFYNLHPERDATHTDAFALVKNENHFLAYDLEGDHATWNRMRHACNNLLIKQGKSVKDTMFKIGYLISKDTFLQFPRADDSELSWRMSDDYDGLWLAMWKIIDENFHFEELRIPLGFMIMLANDVLHFCCLGKRSSPR